MYVIRLADGTLRVPQSLSSDDGRLIGNAYVEISPGGSRLRPLATRVAHGGGIGRAPPALAGGERRVGAGVPGLQSGAGQLGPTWSREGAQMLSDRCGRGPWGIDPDFRLIQVSGRWGARTSGRRGRTRTSDRMGGASRTLGSAEGACSWTLRSGWGGDPMGDMRMGDGGGHHRDARAWRSRLHGDPAASG